MQEMEVRYLGREDPLEKEMATHSGILAWEIPWTEEPSRLQSMRSQRVNHDLVTKRQGDCDRWTRTLQELAVFPATSQKLNRQKFQTTQKLYRQDLLLSFLSSHSRRHWRQAEAKVLDFICRFPSLVPKELQDSHVPRVSLAKRLTDSSQLLFSFSVMSYSATP